MRAEGGEALLVGFEVTSLAQEGVKGILWSPGAFVTNRSPGLRVCVCVCVCVRARAASAGGGAGEGVTEDVVDRENMCSGLEFSV